MKKLWLTLSLPSIILFGSIDHRLSDKRIDVLTHFSMDSLPHTYQMLEEEGYSVDTVELTEYENDLDPQSLSLKKIYVMNQFIHPETLAKLPKEKLVLFNWEPSEIPSWYFDFFSTVYTWNDNLLDGQKFFKIYYPSLLPMKEPLKEFEERKFCTLIASNWTKKRMEILSFFSCKAPGEFECYGYKAPCKTPLYKGAIEGWNNSNQKVLVLENYKFCICFENTSGLSGYITEKIFPCFAAGCIPVYLGASNIEDYIPKECYIDYRDFTSNEELYRFLKRISKDQYLEYLNHIRSFLESIEAQVFTPEQLGKAFLHAAS